ncbi:GGDEF domain-containing protein [Azospirillum picis]|uniref:diguanylate cyclase n=1 Tax=Azospirillum picis TaxID=488438 RepID=A0ABU0MES4_9PROT|nr:GGDEF domain-containing protein [Azospirillum picis]MBP2298105.1 diguanylate cyclase [Azospirillum picis]MDQ0531943.1 diguanylate cyclase [Azospirillum picis]
MEDFERSSGLAAKAMERMLAERLPPTPENFTLWYVYFSGVNPDLTRAIDLARRDGLTTSQGLCDELYKRFFALDAEAQAIRETSDKARYALGRILEQLGTVGSETERYGNALSGFREELDQPLTLPELRAMVAAIAAETKAIVDRQAVLQHQLQDSSQQLAEMRVSLDSARREALTDGLTGIGNRKAFDLMLQEAMEEAVREQQPLSLLMLDIDHFKSFNDTHGHLVGDHVLKLVARMLTECIKGRDTAARYGGEEFAIILPRTSLENAAKLADQVRAFVGGRQIVNKARNANYGTVALSVGVAALRPGDGAGALVRRADHALYAAKRGGRNRVAVET